MLAANRSGKTLACAAEAAYHSLGIYPEWWEGKRFSRPTFGWAGGTSNETVRDVVQGCLMGKIEAEWGTGMIPHAAIHKVEKARGIIGAIDKVYVKHISGGISTIQFKTYEQGWEKWTGEECDWVWFDEEPGEQVYKEGLTRTNNTRGVTFLSLTPLKGLTEVVSLFYPKPDSPDRSLTMMTIDDALHFDADQRRMFIEQYKPYEREARLKGIPMLGSGRCFPVADEVISIPYRPIPPEWPKLIGIDFGWDHPTAAVKMAYDRWNDCIYICDEYRVAEEVPAVHSAALKAWGSWLPVAWPHDGSQTDATSGKAISNEYRKYGCKMHFEHATFENGSIGLTAGVDEMLDRMRTNRWKVMDHCTQWFDEFHVYHREKGKIIREVDDLLCASRYAMMMKRIARIEQPGVGVTPNTTDWDPINFDTTIGV